MREIIFRGKRIDTGEWVYGNFVLYEHMGEVKHIIVTDWAQVYVNSHFVIPETVGQDTGLKDKKGKKIFEGDAVGHGYIVTYIDGKDINNLGMSVGFYAQRDDFESWAQMEVGEGYKIIGNIHDNPELVED